MIPETRKPGLRHPGNRNRQRRSTERPIPMNTNSVAPASQSASPAHDPRAVTVLECEPGKRLAKLYSDPTQKPDDYDAGWLFRPSHVIVESLSDLGHLLEALATDSTGCVIRGALREGALSEWVPRRSDDNKHDELADFEECARHWVCLDLDSSTFALDPATPRASIEAWRASLPVPLNTCGMVFQLSAKAHLSPLLRGHAWIWCEAPVGEDKLRPWYVANGFDGALAQCVQVHYTANPIFPVGVSDPLEGERVHCFDGPPAAIDWAAVSSTATRASVDARTMPDVPADADALAVLGPCHEHEGHIWYLCGALGGVWRKLRWSAPKAKATIEAWLEDAPNPDDVGKCVKRCLGAWELPPDQVSGAAELALHLGGGPEGLAWAERIAKASGGGRGFGGARPAASGGDFHPADVGSKLVGDLNMPALLLAPKKQMYVRAPSDGYAGPYPLDMMRVTLAKMGLLDVLGCDSTGKPLKDDALAKCGSPVHKIVRSFEDTGMRYDDSDPEECTLHWGYRLPKIEPVHDERVAAWLAALAGPMLPNLLDWITLCSQENIIRRAAALAIIGEHSTGKSLIFKCLARMWGALSYVDLRDAVAQFNASICECPIVCDDECDAIKDKLISSEKFRQRVQARVRKYEPKGFEKVHLLGYTREGLTANHQNAVAIANMTDASTREAVEARLCVVHVPNTDVCRAALLAIAQGDEEREADAIMGHLAWLWGNHTIVSTARFAASGGRATAVALAGTATEGAEVWDYLHAFLTSDNVGAGADATARPFIVQDGELLCYPQALAAMLALKGGRWDAKSVGKVLGAIRTGERVQVWVQKRPVRYWPLDFDRAIELAGVDADALMARMLAA